MLANEVNKYRPLWAIGPIILSLLALIAVGFCVFKYLSARKFVGYAALVGTLAGFIYNVIILASTSNSRGRDIIFQVNAAYYIFYSIYVVFAFIPGLIVFHKFACQKESKSGKYTAYFGFFWSAIIIIIGFVLTIIKATTFSRGFRFSYFRGGSSLKHFRNLVAFLNYSNWVLIAIFVALLAMFYKFFQGKSRNTFFAYVFLNIASVLATVIALNIDNAFNSDSTMMVVMFILLFIVCDIAIAAAFIICAFYGHLWEPTTEDTTMTDKVELDYEIPLYNEGRERR